MSLLIGLAALAAPPAMARATTPTPRAVPLAVSESLPPSYLYVPTSAATRQPLQVLVALHGMGGDGAGFAAPLLGAAERNGWVLLAPTFAYGDWRNPEQVRQDDAYFLSQLKQLVDGLPARIGLEVRPRVTLYGFSRGCQMAHRFAEFYPQSALGVASFSCGTWTLPYTRPQPGGPSLPLAFPFGLADVDRYTGRPVELEALRKVNFLVGVGARDNQPGDVPRQWDPYLGPSRLDRARAYYEALRTVGIPVELSIIPNEGHAESDEMRARATNYLAGLAP